MVDLVILLLIGRELHIVGIGDLLLGVLVDDIRLGKENREGLLTLQHMDERQLLAGFLVNQGNTLTFLVLVEIQGENTLVSGEDRKLIATSLTEESQHQGIHAVILLAIQGLGPRHLRTEPGLLPVTLGILNLINHHLCEKVKSLFLSSATACLAMPAACLTLRGSLVL